MAVAALVATHFLVAAFSVLACPFFYLFSMPAPRLVVEPDRGKGPVRVAVFGDVGRGSPEQRAIGLAAAKADDEQPLTAVFLLGDNLYGDEPYEEAMRLRLVGPFAELFDRRIPFRTVLGNHDYSGGYVKEEINDPRLGMGGQRYYQWRSEDGEISVIFYDSEVLERDMAQYRWLQAMLRDRDSRWVVLAGHHPLMGSATSHEPAHNVRAVLDSMQVPWREYDLLLAGHSHIYERYDMGRSGGYAVTVGSTGDVNTPRSWPADPKRLAKEDEDEVWLLLEASKGELTGRAFTYKGVEVDEFWFGSDSWYGGDSSSY